MHGFTEERIYKTKRIAISNHFWIAVSSSRHFYNADTRSPPLRPYFSEELVSGIGHGGSLLPGAEMTGAVAARRGRGALVVQGRQGGVEVVQVVVAGVPSPLHHGAPPVQLWVAAAGVGHFLRDVLQRRGAVHHGSSGDWECADHVSLREPLHQALQGIS